MISEKAFTKSLALIWAAVSAAACSVAQAQQVQLSEFVWDTTKTGNQTWQTPANWAPAGFPNSPLHVGNLSRPLAAGLNVNIGTGVTVAGLRLGGLAGPVTTDVSGGQLTFRNDYAFATPPGSADFTGDSIVDGFDFLVWQRGFGLEAQGTNANGDANASTIVDGTDFNVWTSQFGRGTAAFVDSSGVAGSVNVISANIHSDNEQVEFAGSRNLTINGNFTYNGDAAAAGVSNTSLRVISSALTVTMNGSITVANNDALEGVDLQINDVDRNQGTLVVNGVITGTGDVAIGTASNGALLPLSTVRLNGDNTFTGSIRAGRGNLILGHDNALGVNPGPTPAPEDDTLATYRQAGPANQFGYNLISTDDARVIRNNITFAQFQTVKGDHSLTLAGNLTQTNNRGLVNNLIAGKTLTLSGRIDIWESNEPDIERRFLFDGKGKTVVTGSIHDDPDASGQNRRLRKSGTGVLVIDVAPGNNIHTGAEVVDMGNLHFANNGSLNVGAGLILSRGGAVGVDTGVSNNTAFNARIDPTSYGGIMLAASDASANLDFTTTLANAAKMTVAAPESGLTFTGSITPANAKYQLGGGTGKLTLPNAQLTGGNSLEVRNGGTVELLGDNTYTGSTTLLTKYTSTTEDQGAKDSSSANISTAVYYKEVAPTLVVDKLSNGGVASSIGSATSDAANLFIQGSTLRYVGSGDSTNRLFTVGTGGATIESSGAGAVNFANTGALGRDEAEDRTGTLDDFTRNPNEIYSVADTSDIIAGMSVTDPDPGGIGAAGPQGQIPGTNPPLIPGPTSVINPATNPTTITGIDDGGTTLGLTASYGFRLKENTRLVFGTVPRTLTLGGTNAGANTVASLISNSTKGGVVGITKTGSGSWVLTGANNYTGPTTIQEGTLNAVAMGGNLVMTGGVLAPAVGAGVLTVGGTYSQSAGSTLAVELASASSFDVVNVTGAATLAGSIQVSLLGGFNPAMGSTFNILTASSVSLAGLSVTGPGGWSASVVSGNILRLTRTAVSTVVPEPGTAVLALIAAAALVRRSRGRKSGVPG